jgi:hypothetical protein
VGGCTPAAASARAKAGSARRVPLVMIRTCSPASGVARDRRQLGVERRLTAGEDHAVVAAPDEVVDQGRMVARSWTYGVAGFEQNPQK